MKGERLGVTLIVLQQILFTIETAAIHQMGGTLTLAQLGLLRSAGGLAVAVCLALPIGWSVLRTSTPWLQLFRSGTSLAYLWVMVFSFSFIPFADATAISYTQALYVAMFAPWILGEVVGSRRYFAIAIGFVGALLIVKPGLSQLSLMYAAILVGTSLNGLGLVLNKYLCRQDNPVTVMLYVNLGCTLGFLHGAADPLPGLDVLPWVMAVGVAGPIGMYLGIVALRHAEASTVAPYLYVRLILATTAASLIFGEPTDVVSICGALIIVLACLMADRAAVQALIRLVKA